jgi:hypothetical protein
MDITSFQRQSRLLNQELLAQMTDSEKQEYMNDLWERIQWASKSRDNDSVLLPALIGNYESKLKLGWPAANNLR